MTSMSFNSIQGQPSVQSSNQPFTLREGQVFHGTIKQLYPNQTAEVQVGNHKFVAKLETPLKAGDAHFFQVTKAEGQAEIKVVTGPAASPQQQMQQLMQSMNLPKTSDMQQILGHYIKQELPITRENMLAAENFIKNLPDGVTKTDALHALQRMTELKMPFTQQVFTALVLGGKTDGMSQNMQQFMQLLNGANVNDAVKQSLMNQIQTITTPLQSELGGDLLAKAVQVLQSQNSSLQQKEQMLTLLKQAGAVDKAATPQNWQPQLTTPPTGNAALAGTLIAQMTNAKPNEAPQMLQQVNQFIAQEQLLTTEQKGQLQQMVTRFSQLPATPQTMAVFTNQLQQQLLNAYSQNQAALQFQTNEAGVSTKEQLLSMLQPNASLPQLEGVLRSLPQEAQQLPPLQTVLQQSETTVQQAIDSKAMEHAIKTVLKGLGLNYEAQLADKSANITQLAQALKPQLMSLLQDTQTPPALRESAEMLVARMSGMTLMSGENGHQHQLVMQVPLHFFGKQMDATLQWNGRMKDDGKIDADYARILFYLTMESLQETVIDMQVQNRIVTINVFNENTNLNSLVEPLKQALKTGLADKQYQLSGLFIKPFNEPQVKQNDNSTDQDHDSSGVDIRI